MQGSNESTEGQLQIRLITKQQIHAVPDVPLSVPQSINTQSLNELVNQLLKESNSEYVKSVDFDFLAIGELLRVPLIEHLKERNVSTETTVEIEYLERTPAPEPKESLLHDDWVSGIQTTDNLILTGCYDNSVNIWTTHGKIVTTLREHNNMVKAVSWIDKADPSKGFISVSHDLTGIIWSYEPSTGNSSPKAVLRGHERGIDCIGLSPNSQKIATGGWDTNLKLWSASLEDDRSHHVHKRMRSSNPVFSKTPISTLKGHKEAITSVNWINNYEVATVSMDHTAKFWDAELYGVKNEIIGQKAFLSSSWSSLNNTLLTSSADRHIRLYDPRSTEGSLCKTTFTSHTLWVSSVAWSNYDSNLFLSGGYDSSVKMWDTRSPKAPLYNLQGHEGQVLKVDWSNKKYMISGGSDNSVHIFKNKHVY